MIFLCVMINNQRMLTKNLTATLKTFFGFGLKLGVNLMYFYLIVASRPSYIRLKWKKN